MNWIQQQKLLMNFSEEISVTGMLKLRKLEFMDKKVQIKLWHNMC